MTRFLAFMKKAGGIREFAPPVLAAIFFLYQVMNSFSLQKFDTDTLGSNFLPRVVGIIGLTCIIGIIVSKIFETMSKKNDDTKKESPEEREPCALMGFIKKNIAVATLILIGIYILLMRPLGFILSSFFYLTVQILLFAPQGKKRPVFTIVLALTFPVAMYFLFMEAFSVFLPYGILG